MINPEQLQSNEEYFIREYRGLGPTYKALFGLMLTALVLLSKENRKSKEQSDES